MFVALETRVAAGFDFEVADLELRGFAVGAGDDVARDAAETFAVALAARLITGDRHAFPREVAFSKRVLHDRPG